MKTSITNIIPASVEAFVATTVIAALMVATFFVLEPSVGRAQDSATFTISQVITSETSFLVDPTNTTLIGSLNGITGGTANGSTTVVVQTNSPTGYTMQIGFFNNGTPNAMLGRVSASQSIRDYPATSTQPTFAFSTASSSSVFAYTITAADNSDLEQSFLNNGTVCNTGAARSSYDQCWMEPTTANYQVINRATDATTGATSTLHFRVHVPNNPNPGLVADTYTATATLTVAAQ